jgi:hypothetical protein
VLPGEVRKSGKVIRPGKHWYDRVGRSLVRKRSGKVIWPGKQSGKVGLT